MLRDDAGQGTGIQARATVTITANYSTSSSKSVTEQGVPDNTTSSLAGGAIALSPATDKNGYTGFTYQLEVANTTANTQGIQWLTLIDGRIEWCAAHGSLYFLVPSPVKAQIRPDKIPYYIRAHRGQSVAAQMREAIAAAPAHIRNHVIFLEDDLAEALAQGREVYFRVDHHLNAYGTWLLYNRLNERIRAFHPELGEMPFYDVPPENVLTNGAFGCYPAQNTKPEDEGGRLHVSAPGEAQRPSGELLAPGPLRYPGCNILTTRPGEGLSVLMSHDSYMRFTLSSWREEPGSVRFPFAPGINRVEAYIFHRITTGFLETAFDRRIHDIVVEQFPEVRVNRNPIGFEFAMKNAAL